MSKEKQIDTTDCLTEMKNDICIAMEDCYGACAECNVVRISESLYNAGYRKQSEGEWKLGKSGCMYFCSSCGYAAHPREVDEWTHCPNCGAKMKGGAE